MTVQPQTSSDNDALVTTVDVRELHSIRCGIMRQLFPKFVEEVELATTSECSSPAATMARSASNLVAAPMVDHRPHVRRVSSDPRLTSRRRPGRVPYVIGHSRAKRSAVADRHRTVRAVRPAAVARPGRSAGRTPIG
jgi:hypothetical protein